MFALLPVPFSAAWCVIAMGGVWFISMVIVYCLFPSLLPGVIAVGGVGFISMEIVYCLFPSLLPGV